MLHLKGSNNFSYRAFFRLALLLTIALLILTSSQVFALENTPPEFLDTTTQPIIFATDGSYDLAPLLHIADPDTTQTLTWSVSLTPIHGTVDIETPSTLAVGADTAPPGSIIFTPNDGYTGSDTFTITVSDGTMSDTREFNIMVYALNDIWDGSRATSFAGGTGILTDPYLIATGAQLAYLADLVGDDYTIDNSPHFELKANLDLNHLDWLPIGYYTQDDVFHSFRGYFNGDGHQISNLTIGSPENPRTDLACYGLFGYAENGEISNLELLDISIDVGTLYEEDGVTTHTTWIGGLVGDFEPYYDDDECVISRVSVSGSIHAGDDNSVGLIAGYLYGTASEISTAGSVISGYSVYAGGQFGYIDAEYPLTGCFNTASVYIEGGDESLAGGLAAYGELYAGAPYLFDTSYSTGSVIAENADSYIELLVGDSASFTDRFYEDSVFFNKEAYLINAGVVAPITTFGSNYGEIGLSFTEMQTTMLAQLNAVGPLSWEATSYPQNYGLPKLVALDVNLGNLYRLNYLANGATSGTAPFDTGSYRAGETILLADNRLALSKGEGYTFLGWNTQAGGDGLSYNEFDTYTLNNTIDLYASWDSTNSDPVVTQVTYPLEGVYTLGQTLDFKVEFDQAVFVTGGLTLQVNLGAGEVPVALFSGNGTTDLAFRHTVAAGDESPSAITVGNLVLTSGNTVTNATLDPAQLSFESANIVYRAVTLDAKAPTMISVSSSPAFGVQPLGRPLYFSANYHEAIQLDTTNGSPTLDIQIGTQTRTAVYNPAYSDLGNGHLVFTYTIATGDLGAVSLAESITPNSAILSDLHGNIAPASAWTLFNIYSISTLAVDAVRPTATSVSFAANARNGSNNYAYADELSASVTFDEVVTVTANSGTPYMELNLTDNSTLLLSYASGSGSNTLMFQGDVSLRNKNSIGVALSPSISIGVGNVITDAMGNEIDPSIHPALMPDLSAVLIDSQAPMVSGYTFPLQTNYIAGETFDLIVNFDETVYLQTPTVVPALLYTFDTPTGTTNSFANYVAGHATNAFTFRYLVENGVNDLDGPGLLGQIQLLGASVTDAIGNPIDIGLPGAFLSSYLFDGIQTEVVSLTLTDLPGKTTFKEGDVLHFAALFNEPVDIQCIAAPADAQFKLFLDDTNFIMVPYVSGSGSNTWLFEYTVLSGDFASGTLLVDPAISSVDDFFADAQNHPFNGIFSPSVVQSLSSVKIDAVSPRVTQLLLPANGSYYTGQTLNFIVRYDEIVQRVVKAGGVGSYPLAMKLYLDSGTVFVPLTGYWNATTQTVSVTPTTDLLFRYTVGANDLDADGIALRPLLFDLSEPYLYEGTHTLHDLAGNPALLSLPNADVSGIKLVAPPPPVVEEEPVVVKPVDPSPDQVLVNGDPNPLATLSREGENQQVLRVDVVETRTLLEQTAKNILFTLPFEQTSPQYTGELNGETVRLMEQKNAIIELSTPSATYTLPAHQIQINQVAEQLGLGNALQNIKVRVQVANSATEQVQFIQQAANKQKVQIIVPPVDFTIECVYNDKIVEVQKFNAYVARLILIPDDVDPASISTAVVLHRDGSLGHVPTQIVLIDGKYYAKINALTNSSYTLVQNQVGFADITGHWAEEAIADMSDRMILFGMTTQQFGPQRNVTRAEFVAMLVRALGLEGQSTGGKLQFNDIALDAWFADAFRVAAEYDLVVGDAFGLARPEQELSREQAVSLLQRALTLAEKDTAVEGAEGFLARFDDAKEVSEYAREALGYFVREGLMVGRDVVTLAPQGNLTRAEAAALLQRTLQHAGLID